MNKCFPLFENKKGSFCIIFLVILFIFLLQSSGASAMLGGSSMVGYDPLENKLIEAATVGKTDKVIKLMKPGFFRKAVNPNGVDPCGRTALHFAAFYGHLDIVIALLDNGADPNQFDNGPIWSPLYQAARAGHLDIVSALLKRGAFPDRGNKFKETPLLEATKGEHLEVVKILLEHGADPYTKSQTDHTAFSWANSFGSAEMRRLFTDHFRAKSGDTALTYVCKTGDLVEARWLLDNGANPDQINNEGKTPLYLATEKGHAEIVLALLTQGANPNLANKDGRTSLSASQRTPQSGQDSNYKSRTEWIIKKLLENGANPKLKDHDRREPLLYAIMSGRLDLVEVLLNSGATINESGWSPLHYASKQNDANIVKALLDKGADPTAKNQDGQTPIQVASNQDVLTAFQDHANPSRATGVRGGAFGSLPSLPRVQEFRSGGRAITPIPRSLKVKVWDTHPSSPIRGSAQNRHDASTFHWEILKSDITGREGEFVISDDDVTVNDRVLSRSDFETLKKNVANLVLGWLFLPTYAYK